MVLFRSGSTMLNVLKSMLSAHLLINSHQILIYGSLHVRRFLNEVDIITDIAFIRQISDLIEELDTHKQDEILMLVSWKLQIPLDLQWKSGKRKMIRKNSGIFLFE